MNKAKEIAAQFKFPVMGFTEAEYYALPPVERFVLAAAYFADTVKVREQGGNNRGKVVEFFLRLIGLPGGNAWCAATVSACFDCARIEIGPKLRRGAVSAWRNWAVLNNCDFKCEMGVRGDLIYYVKPNGKGHIEMITKRDGSVLDTIGGNTDADGSRDGDGMYRKKRPISSRWRIIKWSKVLNTQHA